MYIDTDRKKLLRYIFFHIAQPLKILKKFPYFNTHLKRQIINSVPPSHHKSCIATSKSLSVRKKKNTLLNKSYVTKRTLKTHPYSC